MRDAEAKIAASERGNIGHICWINKIVLYPRIPGCPLKALPILKSSAKARDRRIMY